MLKLSSCLFYGLQEEESEDEAEFSTSEGGCTSPDDTEGENGIDTYGDDDDGDYDGSSEDEPVSGHPLQLRSRLVNRSRYYFRRRI
jgi:hypothetical protein